MTGPADELLAETRETSGLQVHELEIRRSAD